jgi:prepilin-type N-terminal cleavage/methylation domain-containing protein
MRLLSQTKPTRQAFTLVELVVVIAIILVLAALLLSAVFKAVNVANELNNTSDIRQLDLAVQAFLAKYQVPYLPSQIRLCRSASTYTSSPSSTANLDNDSMQYLQRLWPRLGSTWTGVNWDGNTNAAAPASFTLKGQECLVFFLGGIPGTSSGGANFCQGFSTNPKNPADLTAPMNPAFFDFKSERLVNGPSTVILSPGPSSVFFEYLDTYGSANNTKSKPYVYFSSYKTANGYGRYTTNDCSVPNTNPNLDITVLPYVKSTSPSPGIFHNSNGYQIISAGRDQLFGAPAGGLWLPATASDTFPPGSAGADDQTNFYNRTLGIPTP